MGSLGSHSFHGTLLRESEIRKFRRYYQLFNCTTSFKKMAQNSVARIFQEQCAMLPYAFQCTVVWKSSKIWLYGTCTYSLRGAQTWQFFLDRTRSFLPRSRVKKGSLPSKCDALARKPSCSTSTGSSPSSATEDSARAHSTGEGHCYLANGARRVGPHST
jgi:hypothetical protein